jgi:alpha-D-ribose 1-methylphosphonate 5-triphosphate synthase subunit PhnG
MARDLKSALASFGAMALLLLTAACNASQPTAWSGASGNGLEMARATNGGPGDINSGYYLGGRTVGRASMTGP